MSPFGGGWNLDHPGGEATQGAEVPYENQDVSGTYEDHAVEAEKYEPSELEAAGHDEYEQPEPKAEAPGDYGDSAWENQQHQLEAEAAMKVDGPEFPLEYPETELAGGDQQVADGEYSEKEFPEVGDGEVTVGENDVPHDNYESGGVLEEERLKLLRPGVVETLNHRALCSFLPYQKQRSRMAQGLLTCMRSPADPEAEAAEPPCLS